MQCRRLFLYVLSGIVSVFFQQIKHRGHRSINQSSRQSIKQSRDAQSSLGYPQDASTATAGHRRLASATRSNDDIGWYVHSLMLSFRDLRVYICDDFRLRALQYDLQQRITTADVLETWSLGTFDG